MAQRENRGKKKLPNSEYRSTRYEKKVLKNTETKTKWDMVKDIFFKWQKTMTMATPEMAGNPRLSNPFERGFFFNFPFSYNNKRQARDEVRGGLSIAEMCLCVEDRQEESVCRRVGFGFCARRQRAWKECKWLRCYSSNTLGFWP